MVMGGAGFIGSHTVKALHDAGIEAVVFDNFSTGHRELAAGRNVIEGDLMNGQDIRSAFAESPCDAVMHFASLIQVGESFRDPQKYYNANLISSLNLLDGMLEAGIDCFIFSSSAAVYGDPESVPILETHPVRPANPYGQTKAFVESILQDYARAYGLRFISLRYFNAAGADPGGSLGELHEPETHLIPNILRSLLEKDRTLEIFGTDFPTPDGTAVRDYIHVSDLADAHVLALQKLREGLESGFINLGASQGYSVREVIHAAEGVTGTTVEYREGPRRRGDVPILLASNARALERLGWRPRRSDLETIVRTAWEWHRSRPGPA
jgi:UDP-glucose-4-epimerase GalE